MWWLCLSCEEEKALQGLPISFLVLAPHTQRFQIQAGQLLIEDITWFLPGLVNTSHKLVLDHRREARAKTYNSHPPFLCCFSHVTFVRSICCLRLHACEPALSSHFISHHYRFGARKTPELRTVSRHGFHTPLRQLWGSSSSWPAPWFRKGKVSSGGCSTTAAHSEQFL